MSYRVLADELLETLNAWDELIQGRGKIHLIACGGTALTFKGHKPSTKDVDFIVPELKEYKTLITFLKNAGYEPQTEFGWKRRDEVIIYDLYPGNKVYKTELLRSPLDKGDMRKSGNGKKSI